MGSKIVVYSAITSGYDSLKCHKNSHNPDVDFICFTDNTNLKYNDNNWMIRNIPEDLNGLSKVKQQRLIKILPHKYLSEYEISIWVDGNIQIMCDVDDFLKKIDLEKHHFYTRRHPVRDCIYDEAKEVLFMRKDVPENVVP